MALQGKVFSVNTRALALKSILEIQIQSILWVEKYAIAFFFFFFCFLKKFHHV